MKKSTPRLPYAHSPVVPQIVSFGPFPVLDEDFDDDNDLLVEVPPLYACCGGRVVRGEPDDPEDE